MIEFKECASCAAKPGSPYLCAACLHNRAMINRLADFTSDHPLTKEEVRAALHAGHVERRVAEGDNAWTSLVRQRDEARALADGCETVAKGRKAAFEALVDERDRLRAAIDYLRQALDGYDATFDIAEEIAAGETSYGVVHLPPKEPSR